MGILLSIVMFYLAWLAITAGFRSAKLGSKAINGFFDNVEDRVRNKKN